MSNTNPINMIMERHNVNMVQIAAEIGVSPQSVKNWSQGASPSDKYAVLLAEKYGGDVIDYKGVNTIKLYIENLIRRIVREELEKCNGTQDSKTS